jgi:hypothetical protein
MCSRSWTGVRGRLCNTQARHWKLGWGISQGPCERGIWELLLLLLLMEAFNIWMGRESTKPVACTRGTTTKFFLLLVRETIKVALIRMGHERKLGIKMLVDAHLYTLQVCHQRHRMPNTPQKKSYVIRAHISMAGKYCQDLRLPRHQIQRIWNPDEHKISLEAPEPWLEVESEPLRLAGST